MASSGTVTEAVLLVSHLSIYKHTRQQIMIIVFRNGNEPAHSVFVHIFN